MTWKRYAIIWSIVILIALVFGFVVAHAQEPPTDPPPSCGYANDACLSWDASAGATEYAVYYSDDVSQFMTTPDQSGAIRVNVGNVLIVPLDGLPGGCATQTFAVTASNSAGQSPFSETVATVLRPRVDPFGFGPSENEDVWLIEGKNFDLGVQAWVKLDGQTTYAEINSLVRDSCESLSFQVTQIPGAAQWQEVVICNGPSNSSLCSVHTPTVPVAPAFAPVAR